MAGSAGQIRLFGFLAMWLICGLAEKPATLYLLLRPLILNPKGDTSILARVIYFRLLFAFLDYLESFKTTFDFQIHQARIKCQF